MSVAEKRTITKLHEITHVHNNLLVPKDAHVVLKPTPYGLSQRGAEVHVVARANDRLELVDQSKVRARARVFQLGSEFVDAQGAPLERVDGQTVVRVRRQALEVHRLLTARRESVKQGKHNVGCFGHAGAGGTICATARDRIPGKASAIVNSIYAFSEDSATSYSRLVSHS